MKIILIRHAHALPIGESGIETDEERPLSDKGQMQSATLAETLRQMGAELDLIITSPLKRAQETAEILAQGWPAAPDIVVNDKLCPGECKAHKLARILRERREDVVAVVGHAPDISEWAAGLIGSKKACIDFAKGAAACIEWDNDLKKGNGALMWLITPKCYLSKTAHEPVGAGA